MFRAHVNGIGLYLSAGRFVELPDQIAVAECGKGRPSESVSCAYADGRPGIAEDVIIGVVLFIRSELPEPERRSEFFLQAEVPSAGRAVALAVAEALDLAEDCDPSENSVTKTGADAGADAADRRIEIRKGVVACMFGKCFCKQ